MLVTKDTEVIDRSAKRLAKVFLGHKPNDLPSMYLETADLLVNLGYLLRPNDIYPFFTLPEEPMEENTLSKLLITLCITESFAECKRAILFYQESLTEMERESLRLAFVQLSNFQNSLGKRITGVIVDKNRKR